MSPEPSIREFDVEYRPTIEYVGADGVRRELDFQRAPHAPWQALLVESEVSR